MPTIGALAARVLRGYSDKQTALPLRLVLQLAAQLKRAGVQDRTVQPRLLRHLLRGRLAHVLNLQVLDYDNGPGLYGPTGKQLERRGEL